MLIVKIKRINSQINVMVLAEDETVKTRVLEYGADEFATKPVSAETVATKATDTLLSKTSLQSRVQNN